MSKVNNISSIEANKLLNTYNIKDNWQLEKGYLWSNQDFLLKVKSLGISEDTIEELKLGMIKDFDKDYLKKKKNYNNK